MRDAAGMAAPEASTSWGNLHRIAFRLCFLYFGLYIFPGPLLGAQRFFEWVDRGFEALVPWVGERVLHLSRPAVFHPSGSGDTLANFVLLFCLACLAVAGTLVWSVLDRKRPHYRGLHAAFRIILRFTLASAMLTYGFIKVFPSQFQLPDPATLMEPYGRSSPMHLAWTFFGTSQAYTVFAGLGEVAGGLLLLFRRTATLGALVTAVVMANVTMINFCFDVPVKLYSLHLLAMSVLIALPDAPRLLDAFVLQRPVAPPDPRIPFDRIWVERSALAFKFLYVAGLTWTLAHEGYRGWKTYGNASPKLGLHGLYTVETFLADGRERPPLTTDPQRWSKVAIFASRGVVVQFMDERRSRFRLKEDPANHSLTFTPTPLHPEPPDPKAPSIPVDYEVPDPQHLILQGTFDGKSLTVRLRKEDTSSYLLLSRGFHWVSEYPYNR